ncbi:DUF6378 domain-containing protein [Halococcus sp. AFM35]|uniref:DUF6378 domain-containing protein n=1 Tax=Halococcus sp. AFM35 TaxID=3421653 RepID=UPI003EBD5F20
MTDGLYGAVGGIYEQQRGDSIRIRTRYHGQTVVGTGETRSMAVHDLGERMQQLDEQAAADTDTTDDDAHEKLRAIAKRAHGQTADESDSVGRTDALDGAKETVGGRDGSHGEPEDNFGRIATMWSAYLGDRDVKPHEVADMMVALKLCRIASGHPDHDHHVDICGYGTLGAHLAGREQDGDGP